MIPELHRIYPVFVCCKLDPIISAVEQDPNIKVFLSTQVDSISGQIGNFQVKLKEKDKDIAVNVAGILLAGGIEPFDPSVYENYAYFHPNVLTS